MNARRKPCPICARPAIAAVAPFCSVRCKDDDLRRWLVGAYRIAGDPVATEGVDDAGTSEKKEP